MRNKIILVLLATCSIFMANASEKIDPNSSKLVITNVTPGDIIVTGNDSSAQFKTVIVKSKERKSIDITNHGTYAININNKSIWGFSTNYTTFDLSAPENASSLDEVWVRWKIRSSMKSLGILLSHENLEDFDKNVKFSYNLTHDEGKFECGNQLSEAGTSKGCRLTGKEWVPGEKFFLVFNE